MKAIEALGCSLAPSDYHPVTYSYDHVDIHLNNFLGSTGGWVDCWVPVFFAMVAVIKTICEFYHTVNIMASC